ncbi:uncharacterized protein MONBRDRAFT_28286 [Monosiga brevicollis MX1]|uniref:Microtubule-associated protein 1A/B/S-like MBL-like domain-containing protein n=1 Tax=Monosiga brevicollis TaxID=81824 RepID=A9V7Q7_MONBE|nr:uncharacterized protein MONBRDRAFT_28286 [Monosiga brevicollis MX1]EDQ86348.1 predicted protein [Monosiga brevicollis MX1]|eukprot:XP_001748738.1 hypothetical protein [Monosiga brevicollis MX1]
MTESATGVLNRAITAMATIEVRLKEKSIEDAKLYWVQMQQKRPWKPENRMPPIPGISISYLSGQDQAETIVKIGTVQVNISGERDHNWEDAWTRALTIGGAVHLLIVGDAGGAVHLLIVGDAGGLDEHLVNDVLIVAGQAGLAYVDVKALIEAWPSDSHAIAFTQQPNQFILALPSTADDINSILRHSGETFICESHIYYSGHGDTDGSWTTQAEDALSPAREVDANPALGRLAAFLSITQEMPLEEVKDKMESCLSDPSNSFNSALTKSLVQLIQTEHRAFPDLKVETQVGTAMLHMVPYSFGWLDASGAFFDLYNLQDKVASIKPNAAFLQRGKTPTAMTREAVESKQLHKAKALEIYIFGAGRGESSFVRFPGCNLLIDGGIHKNPLPCFWQLVRRLPSDEQLDLVVCTHYDNDHLNGLQRLLDECKKNKDLIGIGHLYTMKPPTKSKSKKVGRSKSTGSKLWVSAVHLLGEDKVHNLCIDRKVFYPPEPADSKLKLEVQMLSPPDEATLTKATELMDAVARSASPPNKASASLLVTATWGDVKRRALFTGDAPSPSVVAGLREATNIQKDKIPLVYADAPHHGSMLEQPNALFEAIDPEVFAVSTDGTGGHGHPDQTFLDEMSGIKEKACWFNYTSHALPGTRRAGTSGTRQNAVQSTFPNANYIDNQAREIATAALRVIITKDLNVSHRVNADGTE